MFTMALLANESYTSSMVRSTSVGTVHRFMKRRQVATQVWGSSSVTTRNRISEGVGDRAWTGSEESPHGQDRGCIDARIRGLGFGKEHRQRWADPWGLAKNTDNGGQIHGVWQRTRTTVGRSMGWDE